jgi:hypothetical protein
MSPPLPVTGIALLSYMYMMFVLHGKHMYGLNTACRADTFNFILNISALNKVKLPS